MITFNQNIQESVKSCGVVDKFKDEESIINITPIEIGFTGVVFFKKKGLILTNKMLVRTRPKGLPIETPSIWAYIFSSKLNSTPSVSKCINSKNKASRIVMVVYPGTNGLFQL